jgi:hypothetical protein
MVSVVSTASSGLAVDAKRTCLFFWGVGWSRVFLRGLQVLEAPEFLMVRLRGVLVVEVAVRDEKRESLS